jgi:PAS domain S-box-containing protein
MIGIVERYRGLSLPVALCLIAGIFLLDLATPLGKATWTLYLVPLLLTLGSPTRQAPVWLAGICTGLIGLGILYSPPGAPPAVFLFNRVTGVAVLWLATLLIMQRRAAAQEAQARLSGTVDIADDAIISVDRAQRILLFNQGAERIFGYQAREVLGQPLDLLLPERFLEAHRRHIQEFADSPITVASRRKGERREILGRRKDGSEFPAEASISKLTTDDEPILTVILRDITSRKRVEQRIAVVHAVTRILAEAPTIKEAVPEIIRTICEGLGWEAGAVWELDPTVQAMRCLDVWHVPAVDLTEFEAMTRATPMPRNIGLPGRVWGSGEPAWIVDATKDPNFPRAVVADQAGLHGAFAFPIRLDGATIGVLEFFSRQPHEPDQALLEVLDELGSQIGQFIKRKRAEYERDRLVCELQEALDNVKTLRGLLPICASCKKIRNNQGYWDQIETYISARSEAEFTHGTCPDCMKRLYPDLYHKLAEANPDLFKSDA